MTRGWFKSSFSNPNGNCVEVNLDGWFKSSFSNPNGSCVEVNLDSLTCVRVRDSKNPHGGELCLPSVTWKRALRHGLQP